jgi:hypothetical protein
MPPQFTRQQLGLSPASYHRLQYVLKVLPYLPPGTAVGPLEPGSISPTYAALKRWMRSHHAVLRRRCEGCGEWIYLTGRSDKKTCGNRCRQKAFRKRQADAKVPGIA